MRSPTLRRLTRLGPVEPQGEPEERRPVTDCEEAQAGGVVERQAEEIRRLEGLYREEQALRRKYFDMVERMKGKVNDFCSGRTLSDQARSPLLRTRRLLKAVSFTPPVTCAEAPQLRRSQAEYSVELRTVGARKTGACFGCGRRPGPSDGDLRSA